MVTVPTVAGSGSVRPGLAFMCPDTGSGSDDGGSVTWPSPSTQSHTTTNINLMLENSGSEGQVKGFRIGERRNW